MFFDASTPPRFDPPLLLRNPHTQLLASSLPPRGALLKRRHRPFLESGQWLELDAGHGVTLAGELNTKPVTPDANTLIIVLHGWEGSSQSNYVVSSAAELFSRGYDTFRLNFRDHGKTHHLNRGIFNSSLIEEVVGAINALQQQTHYQHYGLMGFSLGANFALRAALRSKQLAKPLEGVLAVSPVLDPAHSMQAIESGPFFYEKYFATKWARSLKLKLQAFPEYRYGDDLKAMDSLAQMNRYFIPRFTQYGSVENYFKSYTLTGRTLALMPCKAHILAAEDDPINPAADFEYIALPANLTVNITQFGSHCAYLTHPGNASWADHYAINYFNQCCG